MKEIFFKKYARYKNKAETVVLSQILPFLILISFFVIALLLINVKLPFSDDFTVLVDLLCPFSVFYYLCFLVDKNSEDYETFFNWMADQDIVAEPKDTFNLANSTWVIAISIVSNVISLILTTAIAVLFVRTLISAGIL